MRDTVLARVVQHSKGRASGIEGDISYFVLFTFRGGKIVRMESVMGEDEALEAVGLSEEPMSQKNVEIVRRGVEAAMRRPEADSETVNRLTTRTMSSCAATPGCQRTRTASWKARRASGNGGPTRMSRGLELCDRGNPGSARRTRRRRLRLSHRRPPERGRVGHANGAASSPSATERSSEPRSSLRRKRPSEPWGCPSDPSGVLKRQTLAGRSELLFRGGNSSKGPNDGGAKCHPPGQTVDTPGCK